MQMIFDNRWADSGGIGRFCQEISQSTMLDSANKINGNLSQALSFSDIFRLSIKTLKAGWFLSPGYNGPILGTDKAIITVHDLMHVYFSNYQTLKNRLYYELIVKRIVRNAPLVFTVSEFTRFEIQQWANVSPTKIVVLNNGIDHGKFNIDVLPVNRYRPYFFYVGNNKKHKNLELLIRAFFYSKLYHYCDLILSCFPTEDLNFLVAKLGLSQQIIFLSGVDELLLASYYKGALATVVVSFYEGFCLPIVESMAVGTPVITSNITAMPETAGGAALLADPRSLEDVAAQMQRVYEESELREQLIHKGLIRAQDFSWDKTRAVFNNALKQIIGD